MTISSGSRLGPYEIVAPVGAGGMGEVWKARDTRLDRSVAVKILPAEFASNAQFKLRFDREAKTISQLNHANICTLFDIGDHDGTAYLVMELLEGESLADRVARGPMPLADVLKYGVQIAEALGRAHREHIIHRDLKPGNIMLTKSGAKLLDFGLAKTVGSASVTEATVQKPLTEEGVVVGTFQYMAPEQIGGEEPDERTDIFALGCVLYEMATGRRAFEGKTRTSLIAAIVGGEPKPMSELQPVVPAALQHVVGRCLAKDRDDRWQSAIDVAEELRWIREGGSQSGAAALPAAIPKRIRERVAWSVALVAAIVAVAAGVIAIRSRPHAAAVRRLNIALPEHASVTRLAVAPDGSFAFAGWVDNVPALWIRPADHFEFTHVEGRATSLAFSRDSQWVAFISIAGDLKKVAAGGGTPITLCSKCVKQFGSGIAWGSDGTIYFAERASGIFRIPAAGGKPVAISKPDASRDELSHRYPWPLPDGRHLLITIKTGAISSFDEATIAILSIADGKITRLIEGGTQARYLPSGQIVFVRGGKLFAVNFDPKTLQLRGSPVPVVDEVMNDLPSGYGFFDVSDDSLAYIEGHFSPSLKLMAVDASGHQSLLTEQPYAGQFGRVSPDGRRIALTRRAANDQIVIVDLERGSTTRLSFEHGNAYDPVWTPDGVHVIYWTENTAAQTTDLMWRAADGSGPSELLMRLSDPIALSAVSPDGKWLLYARYGSAGAGDLWLMSLADRTQKPFLQTPFEESQPRFSRDGRWVAYVSSESGQREVYVRPFEGASRQQVSSHGGADPKWSPDGRFLYYRDGDDFYRVEVKEGAAFSALTPQKFFTNAGDYEVLPDGRLIVGTKSAVEVNAAHLNVIVNWPEELRARMAQK